jgi:hypothetical protein
MALLNSSAYYPAWMQQKDSMETKSFATISYTAIPYNVISDSAIKVTDTDIDNYIKEHKQLFKQEPAGYYLMYHLVHCPMPMIVQGYWKVLIN